MPRPADAPSREPEVHVEAWCNGRRFTHDGTPRGLLAIARAAGVRSGELVATHLPGPVVVRMDGDRLVPDASDFERARRGGHAGHSADTVAPFLDPEFRPLLDSGHTAVGDYMSDGVPDRIVSRFATHRSQGSGLACCNRFADGRVMVILDIGPVNEASLRHEMIHASQCLEDRSAMSETLANVAGDGSLLRALVLSGDPSDDDLRCVHWMEEACSTAAEHGDHEPTGTFELALAIYPPEGIRSLASALGIHGKRAAAAALFAGIAAERGLAIDPQSELAREIVAYRFMGGLGEGFSPMLEAIDRHLGAGASPSL